MTYILNGTHEKNYFRDMRIVIEKDNLLPCHEEIELKDDQLSVTLLPDADHYTWFRCGTSKKKPLCNGSLEKHDFQG